MDCPILASCPATAHMVEVGHEAVTEQSPQKSTETGIKARRGVSRKLSMRSTPIGKLLAERRGVCVPPAICLPPSASAFTMEEDTRPDVATGAQRDILFSSAAGYIRSGSVSSAELNAALGDSSVEDSASSASTIAESPDSWAAVEFESFMCSVARQSIRMRAGSESRPTAGRAPCKRRRSSLSVMTTPSSGESAHSGPSPAAKRLNLEPNHDDYYF
eukprot:m.54611 g.54611  ORF g.54611 m.54611 type:complete len:217 (+) comp7541_c0_seq1:288-938(+)